MVSNIHDTTFSSMASYSSFQLTQSLLLGCSAGQHIQTSWRVPLTSTLTLHSFLLLEVSSTFMLRWIFMRFNTRGCSYFTFLIQNFIYVEGNWLWPSTLIRPSKATGTRRQTGYNTVLPVYLFLSRNIYIFPLHSDQFDRDFCFKLQI